MVICSLAIFFKILNVVGSLVVLLGLPFSSPFITSFDLARLSLTRYRRLEKIYANRGLQDSTMGLFLPGLRRAAPTWPIRLQPFGPLEFGPF